MDQSTDSGLSELLSSSGEIEGLFQQKRRLGADGGLKVFVNGSLVMGDPTAVLPQQVLDYNRKRLSQYQLELQEDQVYSGLLRFHLHDDMASEDIHVRSTSTCAELLPELESRFLQARGEEASTEGTRHHCIALMQGEMERELDVDEVPLQIALDCSSKGLALPKFVYKSTLTEISSPPHQTNKFTSYVGALSYSSNMSQISEVETTSDSTQLSPERTTKVEGDRASLNSLGSAHSSSSSKSGKSTIKSSTSVPVRKKKGLSHTLSNQEASVTSLTKHKSQVKISGSPGTPRRLNRPRMVMSNFISRSLRMRKKSKQPNSQEEHVDAASTPLQDEEMTLLQFPSLVSPLPMERRFTMSTVIHIYYTDARKAQVYKSVLVSEKATTREVISQALERYNLKLSDPSDFGLFEVIGKWQDVTQTLQNHKNGHVMGSAGSSGTVPAVPNSSLFRQQAVTSVEEFVVCYSRELSPHESPYSAQFYLMTQDSYTRRFELRPKRKKIRPVSQILLDESGALPEKGRTHSVSQLSQLDIAPTESSLCIFGETAHRKRSNRSRKIRMPQQRSLPAERPISPLEVSHILSDTSSIDGETCRVQVGSEVVGDTGPQEIPISVNPRHAPDFAALTCSSPDSGVAFNKDSAKSSVSSEQSEGTATTSTCSIYPASVNAAFLLSLRLHNPEKEFLVHKLETDVTYMSSSNASSLSGSSSEPSADFQTSAKVFLVLPDLVTYSRPICCICRNEMRRTSSGSPNSSIKSFKFSVQVSSEEVPILLNGRRVHNTASLHHGDLIAVGRTHLFMFQDYSSTTAGDYIPEYNWWPHPVENDVREQHTPRAAVQEPVAVINGSPETGEWRRTKRTREVTPDEEEVDSSPVIVRQQVEVVSEGDHQIPLQPMPENTFSTVDSLTTSVLPIQSSLSSSVDISPMYIPRNESYEIPEVFDFEVSPAKGLVASPSHAQRERKNDRNRQSSSTLTRERKLMFSFNVNEEDALLGYLVTRLDPMATECKLAPSYILAMCVEFSLRCNGPMAAARFIQKAVDCIQEAVWDCTEKAKEWRPEPTLAQKPLSLLEELFLLLHPVFFWLANILELYQFLSDSCDTIDFSTMLADSEDADPITTLHSVLMYTFQQAFYPVSNILYHSLPVMLESCAEEKVCSGGQRPEDCIVIDQAVEFLQALLDLLTELNLHLGVVSQFYSNVFFFINAAMFTSLVEQGGHLGLFQHTSGTALRANLNLLEGWACQVGFKDAVLHYLAKFSSAVDLLATPAEDLLQLDWSHLCAEFPALHPAQLHFILSNYLLPSSINTVPTHWTPSEEDATLALNTNAVPESFDAHPGFQLPMTGYTLDLTHPPPQPDHFQTFMESLRKNLKKPKRSVDIVPVVESHLCASIPTLISEVERTPPAGRKGSETESTLSHVPSHERHLDSSAESPLHSSHGIGSNTESQEDLLEDSRPRRRRGKYLPDKVKLDKLDSILNAYEENGKGRRALSNRGDHRQRVERVLSLVAPTSYSTPEKLVLRAEGTGSKGSKGSTYDEWMESHFPAGSQTVTIPRGDKGFGIIMVEGKDAATGDSSIFVQRVLPNSTAAKVKKLISGDRILSIDSQLLDGADYLIAEKYIKEAEDEVSLVIAPRNRSFRS